MLSPSGVWSPHPAGLISILESATVSASEKELRRRERGEGIIVDHLASMNGRTVSTVTSPPTCSPPARLLLFCSISRSERNTGFGLGLRGLFPHFCGHSWQGLSAVLFGNLHVRILGLGCSSGETIRGENFWSFNCRLSAASCLDFGHHYYREKQS